MEENKNITEALKGICNYLTDEQKEKAEKCKSMDELVKLAGEEGIELSDEALDAAAGGRVFDSGEEKKRCSNCGRILPFNYPSDLCSVCRIFDSEISGDSSEVKRPSLFDIPER